MHCKSCGAPMYGHINKDVPLICSMCKSRRRDEAEKQARVAASDAAAVAAHTELQGRNLREFPIYNAVENLISELHDVARVAPDFSESAWLALSLSVDAMARYGLGAVVPPRPQALSAVPVAADVPAPAASTNHDRAAAK